MAAENKWKFLTGSAVHKRFGGLDHRHDNSGDPSGVLGSGKGGMLVVPQSIEN